MLPASPGAKAYWSSKSKRASALRRRGCRCGRPWRRKNGRDPVDWWPRRPSHRARGEFRNPWLGLWRTPMRPFTAAAIRWAAPGCIRGQRRPSDCQCGLAGQRGRHFPRGPRPCLRARDKEWPITRACAVGRGRPECLGTGHAVRPGHHPLRAPRNAAIGVPRTHLPLRGTGRRPADRRTPSARSGVDHRCEHHPRTRR
jgi:hypothetical protein